MPSPLFGNSQYFKNVKKCCGICGNCLVLKNNRDIERKNFCSKKCRSKASDLAQKRGQMNIKRICQICNSDFTANRGRQIFCSKACQCVNATRLYNKRKETLEYHLRLLKNRHGTRIAREKISLEFLKNLYNKQNGRCAISGQLMTWTRSNGFINTNISLDRINSSLGYTEFNVQFVCFIVNIMKRDMHTSELIEWCRHIMENEKIEENVIAISHYKTA